MEAYADRLRGIHMQKHEHGEGGSVDEWETEVHRTKDELRHKIALLSYLLLSHDQKINEEFTKVFTQVRLHAVHTIVPQLML